MYEKKKKKIIEKYDRYMEHKSSELERFCDFLGNIITKYIHEIDLKNVPLIEESNNEIPIFNLSWVDINDELIK